MRDVLLDNRFSRLNAIRADRMSGFYLGNMTVQQAEFNAVYVMESDGFVLDRLGRIPDVGDQFGFDGWLVEVIEMDRRRVARLRLTAPERSDAATAGGAST